ncbi:replication protein P of bacteriophage [Salmonella enterica subsp. enterica serovar Choleraesuis]|nr:replication protein P of bacteriophage [Salmonella enterica subsp. enterica serovar Choleraesuis]
MKNIGNEIQRLDRQHMPQLVDRVVPELPRQQAAQIFNELFRQLRATFPAAMSVFKAQADVDEFRRQWVLAFIENGITTPEQINAGMRIARRQERPFLPSPGQFVAWCKSECCAFGLTATDVMSAYWTWRQESYRYGTSEQYPWPQPVLYHICLELRHRSTEGQLSQSEMSRAAGELLANWEKRAAAGKPVPPVRRAIAAPAADRGPSPAELLLAEYNRRKAAGSLA